MFGLPHQTKEMLHQSILDALMLSPEHISIYSLQVEPKTIFFNRMKKGTLPLPSQDVEAEMYELIIDSLRAQGYSQYEISNFAKANKESRHNLKYWNNEEYFGFGAGSHGYVAGNRVVNAGPVNQYIEKIAQEQSARTASHPVTRIEQIEEEMFLGLRKLNGVNKKAFNHKYGESVYDIYGQEIKQLISKGLLSEDEEMIHLTKEGVFLGNEVFEAFIHLT
jgi:oxygen-independent coproporphyrinogen-3 oxidase